jgi:hypothetical protein
MNHEDIIDKKVLFQNVPVNRFAVHEGKIKEFSPTGKCVKIDHEWFLLNNIRFLEVFTEDERPSLRFVCKT